MLMKSAIWERRVVAKREKKKMNVWYLFKRKVERYVECLFYYFKHENKIDDYYKVFTPEVCKLFNYSYWEVPENEG